MRCGLRFICNFPGFQVTRSVLPAARYNAELSPCRPYPMTRDCTDQLKSLLAERILVMDGAYGTMIQRYQLDEAAYRGERFAGWPTATHPLMLLVALLVALAVGLPVTLMFQYGAGTHLDAQHSRGGASVPRHPFRQHLERHLAFQASILGPVDLAHPTLADRGGDAEVRQPVANHGSCCE